MIDAYNKFFIQLNERVCCNLVYWDRETNVKRTLKLNDGLKSEIIMKIISIQPEILIIEGDLNDLPGNSFTA